MNNSNASSSGDTGTAVGKLTPYEAAAPARAPYGLPGNYGGYGPHGAGEQEAPGDLAASVLEYWRILLKRKWLVLAFLGAFVAFGTLQTLMQTPLYTASIRLQIDEAPAKIVEGGNTMPNEGTDLDFLRTQYELLQSRSMAGRVVSALELGKDSGFLKSRDFSLSDAIQNFFTRPAEQSTDTAALESSAVAIVMANREVRPLVNSRLVDILYADPDPGTAQRIANAFGDAYIASNIDKRFQANAYAKTFLEDQSQQLKLRLEQSEKALLDFSEKEKVIGVSEKSSIAENNLAAANASLGNLVAERIKNEEQWKQVDSATTIDLPQFLNNPAIMSLRSQRNALVTDYQDKLQTFKPAYPVMVEINNRIKEIDRQIAAEVASIKQSLKEAYLSSLSQEEALKKQIETLKQDVLDLQKRSIQYNILKREVDTNRTLYNGLLQRLKEVDIAGGVATNNVFVVDKAVLPGSPSSPNLRRALVLFVALGLGAGFAAAFMLEVFDDTPRSAQDIERLTGLPTLGIIPLSGAGSTIDAEIANPTSAISEAYRSLCTSLQFTTESGLPKSLLVTSASPSEGKSITALAVARHFATVGLKVLVVDADMRNPSLHIKLGRDTDATGLSNYLTGGCTPPEAMQATSIPNLAFMPSGPLPPNAADLLGKPRLLSLLSVGLEVFDLIVLDGPPVMGLADAQLLANASAATIFVVAAGQPRSGALRGALRRLELVRAPVIGAVLTKFDARKGGDYYGYGYGYAATGYGYGRTIGSAEAARPQLPSSQENV